MATALAFIALAAPATSPGDDVVPVSPELEIADTDSPRSFNPFDLRSMYDIRAVGLLYQTLVGYDPLFRYTRAVLAETWTLDEGGKALTYHLRADARWHDGHPVDAEDVVFSVEAHRATHRAFAHRVDGASAIGPRSVRVRLRHQYGDVASAAQVLDVPIVPQHVFQKVDARQLASQAYGRQAVGSGPFSTPERVGFRHTFRRAVDSRPGPAHFDKLVVVAAPDQHFIQSSLKAGSIHAAVSLTPKDATALDQPGTGVRVHDYSSPAFWYLGHNHHRSKPGGRAVREAITLALDRGSLCSAHLGPCTVLPSPVAPDDLRNPRHLKPRTPDLIRARALLVEAGYSVSDGVLMDPKGQPTTLHILVQPPLDRIATRLFPDIQTQLHHLGAKVTFETPADGEAWAAKVSTGKGYDLTVGRLRPGSGNYLAELFHSRSTENQSGYSNPALDALFDTYARTTSSAQRDRLLKAMHDILHEDLPMTPLWTLRAYTGHLTNFEGMELFHPYHFFTHIVQWRRK